jgi:hypothetical protein
MTRLRNAGMSALYHATANYVHLYCPMAVDQLPSKPSTESSIAPV